LDAESLRLFLQLSRSLHFGRTSRECHVSPSALSRSIRRLEEDAGAELFARKTRSVQLTEAGLRMQSFAQKTLDSWDQLTAELSRRESTLRGTLSLFCTVTAAHSLLPALLEKFRRAHPDVTLRLETGYAADALERLQRDEIDVSVAALPDTLPGRFLTRVIAQTPLLFVAPATPLPGLDDLDDREDARTPDFERLPMVLPVRGIARARIDRWFRKRRLAPKVYSEVSGHEAILSLVKLGCGVGIVPELVLEKSPLRGELRVLDVRPRLRDFRVAACIKRANLSSPLLAGFWASLDPA